ncbi:hypothetical protein B0I35DRAFT_513138 [Stachybotrys elegans]|uniref:Uncharacterized protein n=1 Tax=Stachybotrys elegans TaxID=80388 RepID=A0A8K0WP65_9HYPO|nr:hypothetical protein B0I35DRAFT_513138 [Stachybotrys elegans]
MILELRSPEAERDSKQSSANKQTNKQTTYLNPSSSPAPTKAEEGSGGSIGSATCSLSRMEGGRAYPMNPSLGRLSLWESRRPAHAICTPHAALGILYKLARAAVSASYYQGDEKSNPSANRPCTVAPPTRIAKQPAPRCSPSRHHHKQHLLLVFTSPFLCVCVPCHSRLCGVYPVSVRPSVCSPRANRG